MLQTSVNARPSLTTGTMLEITYPTTTRMDLIDVAPRRKRSIILLGTRDLHSDPLTVAEFRQRPYAPWCRHIAYVWNEKKNCKRTVYLGSSDEFHAPGCLRIVTDFDGHREYLARQFEPTKRDRDIMLELLRIWIDEDPDCRETLLIVADDLRVVGVA